jgi:hypothetical protein
MDATVNIATNEKISVIGIIARFVLSQGTLNFAPHSEQIACVNGPTNNLRSG